MNMLVFLSWAMLSLTGLAGFALLRGNRLLACECLLVAQVLGALRAEDQRKQQVEEVARLSERVGVLENTCGAENEP